MLFRSKVDDRISKPQLDAQLAILLDRTQPQLLARHRAQQVALRKVRSVVRPLGFGPDQNDLAAESRITKSCCDCVTGGPAADDQRSGRVFSS